MSQRFRAWVSLGQTGHLAGTLSWGADTGEQQARVLSCVQAVTSAGGLVTVLGALLLIGVPLARGAAAQAVIGVNLKGAC